MNIELVDSQPRTGEGEDLLVITEVFNVITPSNLNTP